MLDRPGIGAEGLTASTATRPTISSWAHDLGDPHDSSPFVFTLDTYAHVMPGMQPEAAEQFMKVVPRPGS